MPYSHHDLKSVADFLYTQGNTQDNEALKRSAISRYYYSAFLCLRTFAELQLGFQRGNQGKGAPDDHGNLRTKIKAMYNKTAADKLERLHGYRKSADYGDEIGNLDAMLERAKSLTEELMDEIEVHYKRKTGKDLV